MKQLTFLFLLFAFTFHCIYQTVDYDALLDVIEYCDVAESESGTEKQGEYESDSKDDYELVYRYFTQPQVDKSMTNGLYLEFFFSYFHPVSTPPPDWEMSFS